MAKSTGTSEKAKRDFRQDLTDEIVRLIEEGTAPWQKPWHPDKAASLLRMPMNATTGRPYRGGNSMWLMMKAQAYGSDDPRWCTFKQAEAEGWNIKKGSKGTSVEYWQFDKEEKRKDPVTGQEEKVRVRLDPPRVFYATVFHATQVEGMPELPPIQLPEGWDPVREADRILTGSDAAIFHDQGDRAYYSPSRDEIHLPPQAAFAQALDYYEVALHELAHWTGHPDRLNRDLSGGFGSEQYAREELRAQMASLYLSAELGVPFNPERHAAYQGSWVKALKEDKNEIFRAARDAEVIADHIRELARSKTQEISEPAQTVPMPAPAPEPILNSQPAPAPALVEIETQTLNSILPGAFEHVVATAPIDRVEHMLDVIDSMYPLNTTNAFWQRHELPFDLAPLQTNLRNAEEGLLHRWENKAAHELTLAEFSADATVEALQNHGRKWSVTLNDQFVSFSDADTAKEAVAESHRNAVNNALYLTSPGNADMVPTGMPIPPAPPAAVLAEYPDLVEKFNRPQPAQKPKLRESIRRVNFEGAGRNEIQEAVALAVEADPEPFIQAFKALPQSLGGRFISADTFKETFEPYRASNEARNLYNTPVHNTAAVLASEQLRRVLQEMPKPNSNRVALLTGIPGAGKTSSVIERGELHPRFHAVYEGQLSDPTTAIAKVQEVLAAGFKPVITVIHQTPEQALDNTLLRFEEVGRGASINTMAKIQGGLPASLATIQNTFGDNVNLLVLDRVNYPEPTWHEGWQNLPLLESEGNYDRIKQRLEQHLATRREQGLSDDAYRQAAGLAPIVRQRDAGIRGGHDRQHEAPIDGRSSPEGNRPNAGVSQPQAQSPRASQASEQPPQSQNQPLVRESDKVAAALSFISPNDRETWVRMAMAVENGLGEDGFAIWDDWSRGADNYNERAAKAVWKSAKGGNGVGLGTLYWEAKQEGFNPAEWRTQASPSRQDDSAERAARIAAEAAQAEAKYQKVAAKAKDIFDRAQPANSSHPYLINKGVNGPHFVDSLNPSAPREIHAEDLKALLGYAPKTDDIPLSGRVLVIPVTNRQGISTLEFIDEHGLKSALAGGKKSGAWYAPYGRMPSDPTIPTVVVEGVATSQSTHEGLNPLGQPIKAFVVAALSDTNIKNVVHALRELRPDAPIVVGADAISNPKSDPIQKAHDAAADVGGHFCFPEFEAGRLLNGKQPTDFNDLATLFKQDGKSSEAFSEAMATILSGAHRAIPGKSWAEAMTSPSPTPPTQHTQEKSMSDEKAPYVAKTIGQAIYKTSDLPADLVEHIKERYGSRTSIAPPKENGTYQGEVYDMKTHLVQEVSSRSVVIHDKSAMGFKGPSENANANGRLDGWDLKIFYDGNKPTAYPHDRQKDNFEIVVNSLKKSARELGKDPALASAIDELSKSSWQRVVESRKKAPTPAKQPEAPAQNAPKR